MLTRRELLAGSVGVGTAAALLPSPSVRAAPPEAAPCLINHVGFTPGGAKTCLSRGRQAIPYQIVDAQSGRTVREGMMKPVTGDLGEFVAGDFTDFTQPGQFELRVPSRSVPFTIAADVYLDAVRKSVAYFAKQRCGDSKTGYRAPCHLDDGFDPDTGKHRDVTGGWHDACDVRKWVNATIYGIIGLWRAFEVLGEPALHRDAIIDEMRWGNAYFHKMQVPDGYLMNYCGGDDGNRFTDNKIGSADDRRIHTEACDLPGQFHFVAAQAAMIRLTRDADGDYAKRCESAARRCLNWCLAKRNPGAATSLGAAVIACCQLHWATGDAKLGELVGAYAPTLLTLQVVQPPAGVPVGGYFLAARDRPEPSREIQHGNLPLLALCEAIETFPAHADAGAWRRALDSHLEYVRGMAAKSAFGTVPFGLYSDKDPGGGRRIGSAWYRWFMKPGRERGEGEWWVGINAHLASNGVGLMRAGRLLRDRELNQLGQRQLDWILGANPFDASTVSGVGRNQPPLFVTSEFRPATPLIPGGVVNGIGGTAADEPDLAPGSYNTCEYWTPMVAYTMWLMAEASRA